MYHLELLLSVYLVWKMVRFYELLSHKDLWFNYSSDVIKILKLYG